MPNEASGKVPTAPSQADDDVGRFEWSESKGTDVEGRATESPPIHLRITLRFFCRNELTPMGCEEEDDLFRLTMPIENAFAFAMGEFGPGEMPDVTRQIVGVMLIDALEYAESWRLAAEARSFLAVRWPHCPGFRSNS